MDEVITAYNAGRAAGDSSGANRKLGYLSFCAFHLAGKLSTAQEAYYRGFIAGWWEAAK